MMPPSLGEEVELELSHMHETVDAVEGLLRRVDADVTVYDRAAGALLLAQYYNGIENIFKRFCKHYAVPVPEGPQSHAALFRLFCEPAHPPLPVLVPPQLEESLRILRRFRHYTAQLCHARRLGAASGWHGVARRPAQYVRSPRSGCTPLTP